MRNLVRIAMTVTSWWQLKLEWFW